MQRAEILATELVPILVDVNQNIIGASMAYDIARSRLDGGPHKSTPPRLAAQVLSERDIADYPAEPLRGADGASTTAHLQFRRPLPLVVAA